jgi:hypothetical protein
MEDTAPLTSWCDPLVIISAISAALYAIFIGVVLRQTFQSRENVSKQISSSNKFQWLINFIQLNSRLIRSFNDYENCKLFSYPYFEISTDGNRTNEPIRDFQGKSLQDRYSNLHNDLVEFDLMIKTYGIEQDRNVNGVSLEKFISFIITRTKSEANYINLGYQNPEQTAIMRENHDGELLRTVGNLLNSSTDGLFSLLNGEIEAISKEVSEKVYG